MFEHLLTDLARKNPEMKSYFVHLQSVIKGGSVPETRQYVGRKANKIEQARFMYECAKKGGVTEEIEEHREKLIQELIC